MRKILLIVICFTIISTGFSQNLSYTCPRDTILGCNIACISLSARFPDIRSSTADYSFTNITNISSCRPYIVPGTPGSSTSLIEDDEYSTVIPITFSFPFYGANYPSLVVSTNGYVSFDISRQQAMSHYQILNDGGTLSAITGSGPGQNLPSALYDKALIMGPYHDIDPSAITSPIPTIDQVKYYVTGTAPNRKWVLSFYKVPLFSGACNALYYNTHQLVLHESTGIVEVFIYDKQICPGWNEGRAMIGMQDMNRTKGIMIPGRRATDPPWGSIGMNESWRFIPAVGPPLFRRVDLLDGTGAIVATGDTTRVDANTFETTFANVCPPASTTSIYVIKTTYEVLNNPAATFYSLDTINITRQPELPISANATVTTCGASTGSIAVSVAGGVAPYQYSINGGPLQASNTFPGLPAGSHTVYAEDAGGCNNTITVNVISTSTLPSTNSTSATSCPGLNNGSITVTPTAGVAPFTYVLDGGAAQASSTFTNLAAGPHNIVFTDALNCNGTVSFSIGQGTALPASGSSTPTSCSGVINGTATITTVAGTSPYTYSIDGGPFQASNVFTGLNIGAHILTVRDAIGCTGTTTETVSPGASLSVTASSIPASCPGVNNATVTTVVSGGTPPYSFVLDSGAPQGSNIFTSVSTGLHTITVTDNNTCSGVKTISVTAGPGLTGTAAPTAASCPGVNNGTITYTPTSGLAPYNYSIDGGPTQLSNIFTGLAAGFHSMTFRDANGCLGTIYSNVPPGTVIAATAGSTPTGCPSASDGTLTVTTTSGASPFTFSIDGGASQPGNIFTSLASGPHTVLFTDANGCQGTVSNTVASGPVITGTASSTATTCAVASNGSITVTPTTGTAPYTYSLDGGPVQPGNIFNGVSPGSHTLTFTDAVGCLGTVVHTVANGPALTATQSSSPTSCPTASNGTITVTPTTGIAPYAFSLDGGPTQVSNTLSGVAAGPHTITFTDINGCGGTVNSTVAAGAAITGSASATGTSCPSVSNGTVTVTPLSGTAPFTFSLDAGPTQPTPLFTSVASGPHIAHLTDVNGCLATANVTVSTGPVLTGGATSTPTACPGVNDGTVTATTTSGVSPYTYVLDGGPSQIASLFTGIAAGIHTVIFTDAVGCSGSANVTVLPGASITSNLVPVHPPCANINDGTLTINPTSGSGPYTYSLNSGPFQSANTYTSLAPGPYTIDIRNIGGCTGSNNITLSTNPALSVGLTLTPPLCNGNSNGSISLNTAGGVSPYQFSTDGGTTYQPAATFNNLTAGPHSLRIRDSKGCIKDTSAILSEPTLLTSSASTVSSTCAGNDGTITITANGGTPAYSYSIDNGYTYQPTAIFTVPNATYGEVLVRDVKLCISRTSAIVDRIDNMFLTLLPTDTTFCVEQSMTFQPQTNAGNMTFTWSSPDASTSTLDDPSKRNATVTPVDTSTYKLLAQWGVCEREATTRINILHKPIPYAGKDSAICFDQKVIFLHGSATNLSGTVNYSWSPVDSLQTPDKANTFGNIYGKQVFKLTVTDNYGCNFSVTDDVTMSKQPPVPAFAGNDTIAVTGMPHQLFATGGNTYLWSQPLPPSSINDPYSNAPLATLQKDTRFTVTITDIAGCIGWDTVFVKVYDGPTYYMANAFTPNNDGLNDLFRAVPVGIYNTEWFRIFNRYGELVFETNRWLKGWDGTHRGKKQPTGVYIWIIKGNDKNGRVVEMKGTVLLIN